MLSVATVIEQMMWQPARLIMLELISAVEQHTDTIWGGSVEVKLSQDVHKHDYELSDGVFS